MTSLRELQRTLRTAIVADEAAVPLFVAGSTQVGAPARIGIYREAYRLRLEEALRDNFPALAALLGEAQFRELTRAHLRRDPPRHFSIRWFGERLPTWLVRSAPYTAQPVLAELARFEWALTLAFDAADASALDASALRGVAPEMWPTRCFVLHPSLQFVRTKWNVAELWRALADRDDDATDTPPVPTKLLRPITYAIWRCDLTVRFDALESAELRALRAARRGRTFADVCELAPTTLDEIAAASWAATLISRWCQRGWVSAIDGAISAG